MLSGRGAVGSAPGLGPGGRRFESCRPDNIARKDFHRRVKFLKQKSVAGRGAVGSAPGLGPGGRRFESCRPDKKASS